MPEVSAWTWVVMVVLLAFSAGFSASETALFSLTPSQRTRAGARVQRVLGEPRDLLVSVLLGNLVVNLLFFAFAKRLVPAGGGYRELATYGGALVAVLVAGEILPKALGLRARVPTARFGALYLGVVVRVLGPLRTALIAALELACRVLGPLARDERALRPEDLARVLERGAERGLLLGEEADFMTEILELDGIRVREIMTPRVDVVFLLLDGSNRDAALAAALAGRLTRLPVVDGTPDQIVGQVRVRDLCVEPGRAPAELLGPVQFVPEVASALDLMQVLREARVAEAVVVDEWGGTAGIVTLEDIFEEIVGELRIEGEAREKPAIPLGEGRYRVNGGLSIRDWNEEFGCDVVPTEFETVGGFVTALLGRIPRSGDVVHYGDLELEVQDVRGRRVLWVDMGVRALAAAGSEGDAR